MTWVGDARDRGSRVLFEAFCTSRVAPAMLGGWFEPLPPDGHSAGLPGNPVT
jgi:hypothetical protein